MKKLQNPFKPLLLVCVFMLPTIYMNAQNVSVTSPVTISSGTGSTSYNIIAGNYTFGLNSAQILPSAGTAGNTIYDNGTSWISSGNLFNNGTNVGIGTTSPS